MSLKCSGIFVVTVSAAILGCAASPPGGDDKVRADQVRVYAPEELAQGRYDILKRLRARSGVAAMAASEHLTAARGIAVLQAEAARLGANGLTDVACQMNKLAQPGLPSIAEPAVTCQGTAIRVHAGGSQGPRGQQ